VARPRASFGDGELLLFVGPVSVMRLAQPGGLP